MDFSGQSFLLMRLGLNYYNKLFYTTWSHLYKSVSNSCCGLVDQITLGYSPEIQCGEKRLNHDPVKNKTKHTHARVPGKHFYLHTKVELFKY